MAYSVDNLIGMQTTSIAMTSQVFDHDYLGGAVMFKVEGLSEDAKAAGERSYQVPVPGASPPASSNASNRLRCARAAEAGWQLASERGMSRDVRFAASAAARPLESHHAAHSRRRQSQQHRDSAAGLAAGVVLDSKAMRAGVDESSCMQCQLLTTQS